MYGNRTDHYPATSKLLHWLDCSVRAHDRAGRNRDGPGSAGAHAGYSL